MFLENECFILLLECEHLQNFICLMSILISLIMPSQILCIQLQRATMNMFGELVKLKVCDLLAL